MHGTYKMLKQKDGREPYMKSGLSINVVSVLAQIRLKREMLYIRGKSVKMNFCKSFEFGFINGS